MADDEGSIERAMKLLWEGMPARGRGPKPAHSLEDIADAAIALADAEGLAAVTMQRLAERLGFTKMALYRYVAGRSELVAVMVERALGPPPTPVGADWRAELDTWALAAFDAFCRHPWSIEATTRHRPIGPVEIAWTEAGLTILKGLELEAAERLDVLAVLTGHARSLAQQNPAPPEQGEGTESQMGEMLLGSGGMGGHDFPEFRAAMTEAAAQGRQDTALSFGLGVIFDGLEALMARRRPAT